jgi:choline dehydrogenase
MSTPSRLGGAVKITSSNPFDKPFIDGNYLSTDFDIFTMKESVKAFKRFLAGPAWKDYVIGPFGSLTDANEDDEIERYVREHSVPGHHGTATAAMSPKGASWGVVDSDLKVKGVSGLRVVDASVMVSPLIRAGHNIIDHPFVAFCSECAHSRAHVSYW